MKMNNNAHIAWCFTALLVLGITLISAPYAGADDTIATAHEVVSKRDTLVCGDSIMVIHTVCAPICSSHVRVYNKEWKVIGELWPTIKTAFPEAYIEDGKILWRDNDTNDYTPAN